MMASQYGFMSGGPSSSIGSSGSSSSDDDEKKEWPEEIAPSYAGWSPDAQGWGGTTQPSGYGSTDYGTMAYGPTDYGRQQAITQPGTQPGTQPQPQPQQGYPTVNFPDENELAWWSNRDTQAGLSGWAAYALPYQQQMYNQQLQQQELQGNLTNDAWTRAWTEWRDRGQMGLSRDELALQQQLAGWGQQNALANLDLARQAQGLQATTADRQYGLSQLELQLDQLRQMQNYQIAQEAQSIEQAYNQGRLSNEQRQIALQELANRQQYGLSQREFAEGQRQFDVTEARRQAELAQQLQLAREQMAAQERNALLSATGRNQRQRTQWIR